MKTQNSSSTITNPNTLASRLRTVCVARLLPLFLLLTLPAAVRAQFTFITNGDNTITITGYTGSGGDVTIPDTINGLPVTSIGDYAFSECTSLTRVTIPNSVTSIGGRVFVWCTSLTNVVIGSSVTNIGNWVFIECGHLTSIMVDALNPAYSSLDGVLFNKNQTALIQYPEGKAGIYTIPSNVTSIGSYAFYLCTSLTGITIPNSVTSIESGAFSYCTSLTNATIGNSVTNIGDRAFYDCASLTSITIPNSVTSIGDDAFYWCTSLTSITIGSSVTSIGNGAFSQCSSLTNVTIPNSVISVGDNAFDWCTSLTSITIGSSVTSIGDSTFNSCTSLTSVTIPNSVTSVGIYAFSACTSLPSVTIPNSVTNIGNYAFYVCTSLTNVTIGSSVASIGENAFYWCTSLLSATIPNSVTSIGNYPFSHCTSLTSIMVDAFNPAYSSLDGVLFDKNQTTLIKYPEGKAGSYTIPSYVTQIGSYAFSECSGLTNITIGGSVTSIGDYAFYDSHHLTGVYFWGNAPSLGLSAFWYIDINALVYYLPGTMGWSPMLDRCQTALWLLPNPLILNNSSSFGVQTNRFGFIISWATNIPVVVEACTDLANPVWSLAGTNTLTGGWCYFSDPTWTNYPGRFYRLRSQ